MSTVARTVVSSLSFLIFSLFATSCAKMVRVHTPAAAFMSAEATGKTFGGNLQLRSQTGTEGTLSLYADEIDNPLELNNETTPLGLGLDLGLFQRFDLYYRGVSHESPPIFGVKFQIFGNPRVSAGAGNHSLAVALGGGSSNSERKSDDFLDDDDDYDFEAETKQNITDAMLIYSYRPAPKTVVYSSLRFTRHSFEAKINKSDDADLLGKKVSAETNASTISLGLTQYFTSVFLSLEASAQKTDWTKNEETTLGSVGGAFGWKWD